MDGERARLSCGDRSVASAHGRLQAALGVLRESWDELVELECNRIADEATEVLRRLTIEAARVRGEEMTDDRADRPRRAA